jgi:hypothetical protein
MFNRLLIAAPAIFATAVCASNLNASPYSDAVLASNPVAYYRLGETSGTTAVNSSAAGATLDGTYTNFDVVPASPATPSLINQTGPRPGNPSGTRFISTGFEADNVAIRSGANGTAPSLAAQVDVADNAALDITGALTLEAWVYRDPQAVNGNNEGIVGKYLGTPTGTAERSYCLYYDSRGTSPKVGFVLSDTGAFKSGYDLATTTNIPLGSAEGWFHVAATYVPGTRMAVFLNGAMIAERLDPLGIPLALHSGTANLWIGRQFSMASNVSWEGLIDEVAVYNTALSDATILAHYNAGTSATPPVHPGDFDGDGDVDGADFVAWQTNFPKASGALPTEGDADGDGDVDGADFVVWQTNFPFTPGPGATPIPEPSTIVLAGIWAIALLGHRRRRK